MENLEQQLIIKQEEIINIFREQVETLNENIHLLKQIQDLDNNYIEILEEYNSLLKDELDEVISIASVHGWESSRYEKGQELREKIGKLSSMLNNK